MAAVGAGVSGLAGVSGVAGSWLLSSGVIMSIILLLLLSVLLTALCSDCNRRSFDLQDANVGKNHSTLISVVKLEETVVARENPMIGEIQNDEKDFVPTEENPVALTPWRSHLRAPQHNQGVWPNGSAAVMERTPAHSNTTGESSTEEETPVPYMAWRSHLGPRWQQDPIYQTIDEPSQTNALTPTTNNHEPERNGRESITQFEAATAEEDISDSKPVYAQISRKERKAAPPAYAPEVLQVEEVAEEELSPPLPNREMEIDG
ncbi:uncharacterized protein LOC131459391 isoform X2 [Solea solea]|uniref:uncharacterized protein LOC131459391 isoform X2 n=1 Tax=Solea solea TaxID=90069 RepID=UPI00272CA1E3|nr:uncharacterized protein LOC131459391 isoform X2 [Solea solea]